MLVIESTISLKLRMTETEEVELMDDEPELEDVCSQVADLLAEAGTASEAHVRVNRLRKASSLILTGDTTLLDNFLEEMIAFKSDRAAEVIKFSLFF